VTSEERPSDEDLFAASRELIGDDEAEAARHRQVQARRSAEAGRAVLGPGLIIGRSWPMPRQLTRLFGLVCGVTAVLLLAVSDGRWLWAAFAAALVVGLVLGLRVMRSKVVLEAHGIRVQGVFRTSRFDAEQIRDIEVVDDTPATLQARVGRIPRIQTCQLVLANGRRVPLSTARVNLRTAQNNLQDPELSQLRDVLEAWLSQVREQQASS